MRKKYLLFSLTFLAFSLLEFSCSQALPEVRNTSSSIIFDYKDLELTPDARLAVYIETSTNVRRVEEVEVTSLEKDYVWEILEPSRIEIQGKMYAGNSSLMVPKRETIPTGKYQVICIEADSDSSESLFSLDYDKEIYNMKGSEVADYMKEKHGKTNILIYDSNRALLYYGERTMDLGDNRKIWNQYRSAAYYNVVYVTPDKKIMCVMPEQKVTPSSDK